MPGEIEVLVPMPDGSESCGLGSPLTPLVTDGALTNMGPLIVLVTAQIEDLLSLGGGGVGTGVDEVQQFVIGGNPTPNKRYTLAFMGSEPTTQLGPNDNAATVQTALAALSTIGAGNVTVTEPINETFTVTFGNDLSSQNLPLLTADTSQLGGTITVTEVTAGQSPTGPVTATSKTDSMGQLLVRLGDSTGASWVYKVIPAVRADTDDVVFLGRLVSGNRNDLPAPTAPPPRTTGIVPGSRLVFTDKDGHRRVGTVQPDGTLEWHDDPTHEHRKGRRR
jgi:hypothetical protein